MPFDVPGLPDLRRLNRDNLAAFLPGADASVPNNALRVLSDQNAGGAYLVLLYLAWLSRQFLPDTAEKDWLGRHGQIWLGGREAATFAQGSATVTGLAGLVVPAGTQFAASDLVYEAIAAVTVGDAPTPVPLRALTPGSAGNLPAGTTLSLTTALAGVDAGATVVSLAGGADAESDDSLRERVLARIRRPPMGGDADDYVAWARAVPGVTRAWCSPGELGPGTVIIRFMMDDLRATDDPLTDGFPLPEDVAAVQAAIDVVRPVTVRDCFVRAPLPQPVDVAVLRLEPDTPSTRATIRASLAAMIRDRAAPARALGGARVPAQTVYAAWLSAAVLEAAGVDHFDLDAPDHVMGSNGSLAVLGIVTFSP